MQLAQLIPAVDVVFDALGADATFTPLGTGTPAAVHVLRMRQDPLVTGNVASPGWLMQLVAAEVAIKPSEGDVIVLGSTSYTVRAVREGPQGLSWVCDVDVVA